MGQSQSSPVTPGTNSKPKPINNAATPNGIGIVPQSGGKKKTRHSKKKKTRKNR